MPWGRFAERVLLIEKLSDFINGPSAQASPGRGGRHRGAGGHGRDAALAGIAEVTAGLPGGGAGPTVVDGEWA